MCRTHLPVRHVLGQAVLAQPAAGRPHALHRHTGHGAWNGADGEPLAAHGHHYGNLPPSCINNTHTIQVGFHCQPAINTKCFESRDKCGRLHSPLATAARTFRLHEPHVRGHPQEARPVHAGRLVACRRAQAARARQPRHGTAMGAVSHVGGVQRVAEVGDCAARSMGVSESHAMSHADLCDWAGMVQWQR